MGNSTFAACTVEPFSRRSLAPTSRVSTVNALNFRIIKRTLFAELRNAVPREIELEAAHCVCNRAYPLGHREPVCVAATCTSGTSPSRQPTRRDETRRDETRRGRTCGNLTFPFLSSNYPSIFPRSRVFSLPHVRSFARILKPGCWLFADWFNSR